ncbi:hypothetical protein ACX0G7_04830 [Flavitalea antarctica]
MIRFIPILLICLCTISCKKAIEQKQEQIVMDAITSGLWIVDLYSEDGVVMTADYAGYEFKFNDNETLNALKSGSTVSGTWKPDITQYTITTNFPGATVPLAKLSSTWKLTDSDWDYVKSESSVTGVKRILHLRKK